MIRVFALLALYFSTSAYASSDTFVVAIARGQVPVSVALDVSADYVAVPISISGNEKEPLRNIENVQAFTERLRDAVKKSPAIKLRQGTVSLAITPAEESSFSSYKSATVPSSANLFLIAPLTEDRDVFLVARDITAFAQSIARSDQIRLSFGTTSLGVDAPERFRPRLLPLIQKEIEKVRVAMGNPKSFEVSGLESPVVVMQRDDRNVVVYLPYRLKVGQ